MYMLIAAMLAIALFGGLMRAQETNAFEVMQNTSISQVETLSAVQMNTFATAAYAYATSQGLAAGKVIRVSDLVTASFLPATFAEANGFGQTIQAVTGTGYNNGTAILAYYTAAPTNTYGLPNVALTQSRFAFNTANKLAAIQENAPAFIAAVLSGTGFSSAQMPFSASTSALDLTKYFASYSNTFTSVVDLVNVLPSSGVPITVASGGGSGSGGGTTPAACGAPTMTLTYTGGPQTVAVPAGCTLAAATVSAGGGGGGYYTSGGPGAKVSGTFELSGTTTLTVIVGGGGQSATSNGGGGGGGLSAVCTGGGCTTSSLLLAAGGGGGGGYMGLGGAGGGTAVAASASPGGIGFGGAAYFNWIGDTATGTAGNAFSSGGIAPVGPVGGCDHYTSGSGGEGGGGSGVECAGIGLGGGGGGAPGGGGSVFAPGTTLGYAAAAGGADFASSAVLGFVEFAGGGGAGAPYSQPTGTNGSVSIQWH